MYYVRTVNGAIDFSAIDFLNVSQPDYFADYSLSRFWKPGGLNTPDDPAYSYPAISFTAKTSENANVAFFCALKPIAGSKNSLNNSIEKFGTLMKIRIQNDLLRDRPSCEITTSHSCNYAFNTKLCSVGGCLAVVDSMPFCCYVPSGGQMALDCLDNHGCSRVFEPQQSTCGLCTVSSINCNSTTAPVEEFAYTCFS